MTLNLLMESLFAPLSSTLDIANIVFESKSREEEIKFRELELKWREIDDTRRAIDMKVQQLQTISNLAALVGGFGMSAMVQIAIPNNVNGALLILFGAASTGMVALTVLSMISCSYMLIGLMRFDPKDGLKAFHSWWQERYEGEWKSSLNAFNNGVTLFLCVLALAAWIVFYDHAYFFWASSVGTIISMMAAFFWRFRTYSKWAKYIAEGVTNIDDSTAPDSNNANFTEQKQTL